MCVEWVHKRRKTTMGWCLDPLLTYSKVPSVGTDSVRERVKSRPAGRDWPDLALGLKSRHQGNDSRSLEARLRSAPAGMPVLPRCPARRQPSRGLQTSVLAILPGCLAAWWTLTHVERIHQYAQRG